MIWDFYRLSEQKHILYALTGTALITGPDARLGITLTRFTSLPTCLLKGAEKEHTCVRSCVIQY